MDIHRKINFNNDCIHSKKIGQLLDLRSTDSQYKLLQDHLSLCPICQKKYEQTKENFIKMQVYIPRPVMDREAKENFDREIHQLLKNFGLNEKENKKRKVITGFQIANEYGELVLKTLFSRNVLLSIGFGLGAVLVFRYLI